MAKRKKNKGGEVAMATPSSGGHLSTSIDDVENGFVVNVSGETSGKNPSYFSKRFIANSRPDALRIASTHLAGSKKGGKKKGGTKKRIALKRG